MGHTPSPWALSINCYGNHKEFLINGHLIQDHHVSFTVLTMHEKRFFQPYIFPRTPGWRHAMVHPEMSLQYELKSKIFRPQTRTKQILD